MICMNTRDIAPVQAKELKYEGKSFEVKGTLVRWLIHKKRGGDEYQHNHALRHLTVAPEGNIPMHNHKYTEIIYVLSGRGLCSALSKDGKTKTTEIGAGDFVYTYTFEPHAFTNLSDTEPLVFLCCINCVDDKENCAPVSGC